MVKTWIGDLGNSGIKLCAFRGEKPGPVTRFYGKNARAAAASWLCREKVRVLHVACANPSLERAFRAALKKKGVTINPVRKKKPASLCFRYNFNQLGLDRIADAVAARADYVDENLMVLDCGTALTVNVIEGRIFTGGFILPGLSALFTVLSGNAPALPKVGAGKKQPVFARNTRDAMDSGTRLLFIQGIAGLLGWIQKTRGRNYRIIATGGDA
ncbi:MAG: type III pantothenate kinase, partial [Fibrobacterota bacterium]